MTKNIIYHIVYLKNNIIQWSMKAPLEGSAEYGFYYRSGTLDAIVLAVVSKEPEGTYGYKITQEVRQVIELSGVHAVSGAETVAKG